jgi:hypothetical protein
MRMLASLAFAVSATVAFAASPEVGGGYGAIDAPRDIDPIALAERFCDIRVTRGDMHALDAYFAPKLAKLLDEHAASHLAAAVPWQGYIDQPTSCSIEVLNGFTDTIGVLIKLHYSSPEREWADTLNFERTRDSWWINNIFYEGGGNLRFTLFDWLGAYRLAFIGNSAANGYPARHTFRRSLCAASLPCLSASCSPPLRLRRTTPS